MSDNDPFLSTSVNINPSDPVIYVVYKQGYYGHGIHGIDPDKGNAIEMAKHAARRDKDSHHSYDVYPIPIGKLPVQSADPMTDYGWMNAEPVFSVNQDGVISE